METRNLRVARIAVGSRYGKPSSPNTLRPQHKVIWNKGGEFLCVGGHEPRCCRCLALANAEYNRT